MREYLDPEGLLILRILQDPCVAPARRLFGEGGSCAAAGEPPEKTCECST